MPEYPPGTAAIDARRMLEFLGNIQHPLTQQEHSEGAGKSRQENAPDGVDETEFLEDEEIRNEQHCGRNHHRRQQEEEEEIPPRKVRRAKA